MNVVLVQLSEAIEVYRDAIASATPEALDDYSRIAGIAENLCTAVHSGDISRAKELVFAFSRQASDSYFHQPDEFKILAKHVSAIRKQLLNPDALRGGA